MGGGVGCTVAAVQAEVGEWGKQNRSGSLGLFVVAYFGFRFFKQIEILEYKVTLYFFAKIKSKLHSPYNNLAGWRKLVQ